MHRVNGNTLKMGMMTLSGQAVVNQQPGLMKYGFESWEISLK